jgi:hypothetical protein
VSRAHASSRPAPAKARSVALGLPVPRDPETRALASLRLYPPRWVWPPSFEGAHEWRVLREDIAVNGIRTPLRILRNGWVIDGTHRYRIAQALGLETVPVQVVPIPLGPSADNPLSTVDRLRIERTAVLEALGRRHLTPHQRDVLFLTLEEAHESALGPPAARAARRLANLRRHPPGPEEPPTGPTIDAVARLYGLPACRLKRLLTLAHRGDAEVRDEFKRGTISLWHAYAKTVGADGDAKEVEPVARYVDQRFAIMARMMDAWAACPPEARGRLLDEFARWLDRFRTARDEEEAEA